MIRGVSKLKIRTVTEVQKNTQIPEKRFELSPKRPLKNGYCQIYLMKRVLDDRK